MLHSGLRSECFVRQSRSVSQSGADPLVAALQTVFASPLKICRSAKKLLTVDISDHCWIAHFVLNCSQTSLELLKISFQLTTGNNCYLQVDFLQSFQHMQHLILSNNLFFIICKGHISIPECYESVWGWDVRPTWLASSVPTKLKIKSWIPWCTYIWKKEEAFKFT